MENLRKCQHCQTPLNENQRKNCTECSKEAKRKRNILWHANKKEHRKQKDKINHRSPSYRWHLLKQNGKRRNLEVYLTREHFEMVSKQACYYCDGYLDTDSGWGSHIDRLNNTLGYTPINSVSCCDFCNRIKQDLLTADETKSVIKIIIEMRLNHENTNKPNTSKSNTDMSNS